MISLIRAVRHVWRGTSGSWVLSLFKSLLRRSIPTWVRNPSTTQDFYFLNPVWNRNFSLRLESTQLFWPVEGSVFQKFFQR